MLSADPGKTSLVLVTTCIAASAGGLSTFIFTRLRYKANDLSMVLNGILGGLVGITASADVMGVGDAFLIGAVSGVLIVLSISFLEKLQLDDPVGAVSVHLTCGIWGTVAVGLFGSLAGWEQFFNQLIGISAVGIFAVLTSFGIFFALKKSGELRVTEQEEIEGLDAHEHGTAAYAELKYE